MKVSIIGTGNVGFHLAKALRNAKQIDLVNICGTSYKKAKSIKGQPGTIHTAEIGAMLPTDVVIIAVSDKKINDVSHQLASNVSLTQTIICHTSGSTASDVLRDHEQYGVFYPLQTFTKGRRVSFRKIPMCICANSAAATATLEALAKKLSDDVRLIEDKDRQQVHLSAVLVNNLTNHIIHLAQQRLNDHGIAPDILDSLIMETVRKAAKLGAYHAQTGPARRQDDGVTKSQLAALHNEPQLLDIYKAVTNSITNTYQDK